MCFFFHFSEDGLNRIVFSILKILDALAPNYHNHTQYLIISYEMLTTMVTVEAFQMSKSYYFVVISQYDMPVTLREN